MMMLIEIPPRYSAFIQQNIIFPCSCWSWEAVATQAIKMEMGMKGKVFLFWLE